VPGAGENLSGTERATYEVLDGKRGFAAVCRHAGIDPLSGARTVQLLHLLGAMEATRLEDDDSEAGELDAKHSADESVRECVWTHVKLLGELAAPIVAVEGGEAIRDRLEHVARETSRRFPEILADVRVGSGGSLDPEELIERALRYPGEREREVRLALGQLVSYLEFELMNHPKIPEPEQFLEAVEDLRARI
jgi:hypothetical protein